MKHRQVANSQYIRDLNIAAIFRLIHKYGPVSRKELAENTAYSAATVSNHVKRLLENKFVIETDKGNSTGGRKPVYLTVNSAKRYIIAVGIEVNQIRIMLFNLNLEVKEEMFFTLKNREPEYVLDKMISKIDKMIKQAKLSKDKIMGLGIAVPALIDNINGLLNFAPNLEWKNIDLKKIISERYDVPLFLENEARAAVIGEKQFVYPELNNMVFVSINDGIGCGIIFDGNLYRGASGNAGEFGHIIIDSAGPRCHCGNYGCWETLASLNYISSRYSELNGLNLSVEQLRKKISDGDKDLEIILKETGQNIGIGLVNIINSLSPELLVIGGDILEFREYIEKEIKLLLKEKTLDTFYDKLSFKYSKLSNKASLYGIASMVFDSRIEEEIFSVV